METVTQRRSFREAIEAAGSGPDLTAADQIALLDPIERLAKILDREIPRAAFLGWHGATGGRDTAGDAQKKLDVVANDVTVDVVGKCPLIAAIVSEEMESARPVSGGPEARFLLGVDPIDGSSNTDVNGTLGTIFGYFRIGTGSAGNGRDAALPGGADLALAGYVLYGPSTLLVVADGRAVRGFTLDRQTDEFVLTHDGMRLPARGKTCSANLGNLRGWHPHLRAYIDHLTEKDPATRRPYTLRYTGALVADLHRLMVDGGIYFYPADERHRDGKLRLVYECLPLGFVAERAGGRASTGSGRILDLRPVSPHQRTPFAIGSPEDVALYEQFLKHGRPR